LISGCSGNGLLVSAAPPARSRASSTRFPDPVRQNVSRMLLLGDPDTVGEFVQTRVLRAGLDGIVVNLPANGHDPEAVRLAGRTLSAALG